jgi:hypothetical protein
VEPAVDVELDELEPAVELEPDPLVVLRLVVLLALLGVDEEVEEVEVPVVVAAGLVGCEPAVHVVGGVVVVPVCEVDVVLDPGSVLGLVVAVAVPLPLPVPLPLLLPVPLAVAVPVCVPAPVVEHAPPSVAVPEVAVVPSVAVEFVIADAPVSGERPAPPAVRL